MRLTHGNRSVLSSTSQTVAPPLKERDRRMVVFAEMESHLSVTDRRVDILHPPDLPNLEPLNAHLDWQQPTSGPLSGFNLTSQAQLLYPPVVQSSLLGSQPQPYFNNTDPYRQPTSQTYTDPWQQEQLVYRPSLPPLQHYFHNQLPPSHDDHQPPYIEQPTTRWCPLPGDNRTAAPLATAVIEPYRNCPMEAFAVHDEAIVVGEVQVKSCSEVMLLNHKSCDGDEMPMSNGGLNQHSTSIGIVVAMAAYINAILAHFVKSVERDVA
ncbi:hypothetical protein SASPL_112013 [Salvia splendens]|uniref:Uncharacterized protein n=1 Tax=Salvia splendens TaxID=180675 RepID=A0A8X9A4V9_SALSN|nr:hypothetical protein SASPL_112013 [Salvia splendens]